jgi:predicted metal-dependent phosphoesterase TrpH
VEAIADLHTHTTYSDGHNTPLELLQKAKAAGIAILGIADHDSVGALEEAIEIGRTMGVEVIPGMELSATSPEGEIHVLGYFMDFRSTALTEALAIFRQKRLERVERIVGKLNRLKIPLTVESVLAEATGDSVGRPHIANALVNNGHAATYHQAFSKFIGEGRPAFEKKDDFSPEETIKLIAAAGGLSFLAHPGRSVDESLLHRLIKAGLDGIEVVHPSHPPELVQYYRGIVGEYFLLESGGSDYHGGAKHDDHLLGRIGVPASAVDMMRHRLFPN